MIRAQLNQSRLKGGQHYPVRLLSRVLRAVERQVGKREYALSVAFVAPSVIRRANQIYRGKDHVTDVLSFALDDRSGELLLCYEQAARQAKQIGHPTRDEITGLLIHGLLHLYGYDHERVSDAARMFGLQEQIFQRL